MKSAQTFAAAVSLAAVGFAPELVSGQDIVDSLITSCYNFKNAVEPLLKCNACGNFFELECEWGVSNLASAEIALKVKPCEGQVTVKADAVILGVKVSGERSWSPQFPEMEIQNSARMKGFDATAKFRLGANKKTPGSFDVIADADACISFTGKGLGAKAVKNLRKVAGICSKFSSAKELSNVLGLSISSNRRRFVSFPKVKVPSWNDVTKTVDKGINAVTKGGTAVVKEVVKEGTKAAEVIVDGGKDTLNEINKATKDQQEAVKDAFENAAQQFINNAGEVVDAAGNVIDGAAVILQEGTEALVDGVANGIKEVVEFTDDQLSNLLNDPLSFLEDGLKTVDRFCSLLEGERICGKDLADLAFDNDLTKLVFEGILGITPPTFPYTLFQHTVEYDCPDGNEKAWNIDYSKGGVTSVKPSYGRAGQSMTYNPDDPNSVQVADTVTDGNGNGVLPSESNSVSVSAISVILASVVPLVATC